MLLVTFIIVIGALIFLEWFMNRHERARLFQKIQGPPGALFFGNSLQVAVSADVGFQKLRTWANSYKDFYSLWMLQYGILNIYNPQDIEIIISNPKYNEKSRLYDLMRPWLKDGLLLSKGNKWQVRRKILTPAFHFNILQEFTTVLQEQTAKFIEDLKTIVNDEPLDVKPLMSDLTLNLICETSMGTKLNTDSDSGSGKIYKKAIHDIGKIVYKRVSEPWLVFDAIFNRTSIKQTQKQILRIIHDFPKRIISERRSYIKKYGFKIATSDSNEVLGPMKRRMALLDVLLCAEKDGLIQEEGIQEEVDTFMFEGHDTTATGLIFALLELANNINIQDKVFNEINEVLGESQTASMLHLGQMKYLDCCIKETLRLYPPVPLISRSVAEGVILNGCTVPPGKAMCHIHIFDLHRRADLYPEPLTFDPERFTPENTVNRHPYAYIPFSGGSRNCIGQKFAMLELKSVISSILRKYTLEPVTRPRELKFTADIVLRTTHPIYVKFVKRN